MTPVTCEMRGKLPRQVGVESQTYQNELGSHVYVLSCWVFVVARASFSLTLALIPVHNDGVPP